LKEDVHLLLFVNTPESNNTNTLWPNNKQASYIRLPNRVALVLVMANTLPVALGLSAEGI